MMNQQNDGQWQQGTEQWTQGNQNASQPFAQQQPHQQQMPNQNQQYQQLNTQYQQPYQPQPQTINVAVNYQGIPAGKKSVKKVTYVLLALLLGGLGIHNFYAGKAGLGILYIIFCWTFIPAFAAFIQAIIALCQPSDINGNILI